MTKPLVLGLESSIVVSGIIRAEMRSVGARYEACRTPDEFLSQYSLCTYIGQNVAMLVIGSEKTLEDTLYVLEELKLEHQSLPPTVLHSNAPEEMLVEIVEVLGLAGYVQKKPYVEEDLAQLSEVVSSASIYAKK